MEIIERVKATTASCFIFIAWCYNGFIIVSGEVGFEKTSLMHEVLIPADAAIGSVVYRLRAYDTAFFYPLDFRRYDPHTSVGVVNIEALNCSRLNSVCQANVILKRKLEVGRFYDFMVEIRNQRGQTARTNCSFQATNATTPIEKIFPGAPALLSVSENARRNTQLGTIIAIGNPERNKAVLLEFYASTKFGIHQRLITNRDAEGNIILLQPLDYETQTVHHLTVLANDPWTNMKEDTRNIAGWPLLVAVIDEQDTPPIFSLAPPTTTLNPNLQVGDTVLRVHAEDGDRGNPRAIRYLLDTEDNPYNTYFEISENTGELKLAKPISQILSYPTSGQPILLKVTAEEVRSSPNESPTQYTTVQLALIPPSITFGSPMFGATEYHALLEENASVGTTLDLLQAEVTTEPGDIVALELVNNNGTFDISPSVVEGYAKFRVTVHDNRLLDYESRHYVECQIVAKEVGKGNYSANAKLVVVLKDVNDNPPEFVKPIFEANIQEHAPTGTTVLLVEATDVDREPGSKIKYTSLTGDGSDIFILNPETGLITVKDSFRLDAENHRNIHLTVEALDENGEGLSAKASVVINLLDINDQPPQFQKDIYEFILNPDRRSFTTQAFIRANDKDIAPPNNIIHYELVNSTNSLTVNEYSGELILRFDWEFDELVTLKARAFDEGTPRLSSESEIRIYPPESKSRKIMFIVPGKTPDKFEVAQTIRALTGGRVTIDEVRPYVGDEPGAAYVTREKDGEKSVVVATVYYTKDSVVDINRIQELLDKRNGGNYIREKEETKIVQSSTSDLLWLVILLIILAIIAAIILILCCICRPCPLYIPPKRRKFTRMVSPIEKTVVRGSSQGRESKSVQVAEWFGRKERFGTEKEPIHITIDPDSDSLRRHEIERGSDHGGRQQQIRNQQIQQEANMRDQLYIREGNADILRLVTRPGEEPQVMPVHILEHQYIPQMPDSGKEILMRRFIDQQQAEAARVQVTLPNAVNKLQSEQEFLEASLRQQNALLRQLILERERDLKLETQSLPACTQTDQDIGTQTEPQYLRPPRRKTQSEYEYSENSDLEDEIALAKARVKRRHRMKMRRIRTPIQEESELEIVEKPRREKTRESESKPRIRHTRTSDLRHRKVSSEGRSRSETRVRSSKSGIRNDVLREISASLDHSDFENDIYDYDQREMNTQVDWYSEDSLEEDSPRSTQFVDSKHRYYSETDIRPKRTESVQVQKRATSEQREIEVVKPKKSQSHMDLSSQAEKSKRHADADRNQTKLTADKDKEPVKKGPAKRTSRYMEWYTKNKQTKQDSKTSDKKEKPEPDSHSVPVAEARYLKATEASARKKVNGKKNGGPDHPLLQHSEYRTLENSHLVGPKRVGYEAPYPSRRERRPEEDADSGIVLTKPEMAQKKSVFTIAYNDVRTNQLRPQTSVTP